MDELLFIFDRPSINCNSIETLLMEKRVSCMVRGGFCPLSTTQEWLIDRSTDRKGYPHVFPVGFSQLPIAGTPHMIENHYYSALGFFRTEVGLANEKCVQDNKRKQRNMYKIVNSAKYGTMKLRTE